MGGLSMVHAFLGALFEGAATLMAPVTFVTLGSPGNPVTSAASQEAATAGMNRL
jgi:hypothetical protein